MKIDWNKPVKCMKLLKQKFDIFEYVLRILIFCEKYDFTDLNYHFQVN